VHGGTLEAHVLRALMYCGLINWIIRIFIQGLLHLGCVMHPSPSVHATPVSYGAPTRRPPTHHAQRDGAAPAALPISTVPLLAAAACDPNPRWRQHVSSYSTAAALAHAHATDEKGWSIFFFRALGCIMRNDESHSWQVTKVPLVHNEQIINYGHLQYCVKIEPCEETPNFAH